MEGDFLTNFAVLAALVWFLVFTMIVLHKLYSISETVDYIRKRMNA